MGTVIFLFDFHWKFTSYCAVMNGKERGNATDENKKMLSKEN